MNVLGVRCSNKDIAFAVLDGTKDGPRLIECRTVAYPKGYSKAQSLMWLLREIETIIGQNSIGAIVIKRDEGKFRNRAYEDRVEHEGVVWLAGAKCGLKNVTKKVGRSIAKNIGLKGKAKYLKTQLDTSVIPEYSGLSEKSKEAVLAAWSEL